MQQLIYTPKKKKSTYINISHTIQNGCLTNIRMIKTGRILRKKEGINLLKKW